MMWFTWSMVLGIDGCTRPRPTQFRKQPRARESPWERPASPRRRVRPKHSTPPLLTGSGRDGMGVTLKWRTGGVPGGRAPVGVAPAPVVNNKVHVRPRAAHTQGTKRNDGGKSGGTARGPKPGPPPGRTARTLALRPALGEQAVQTGRRHCTGTRSRVLAGSRVQEGRGPAGPGGIRSFRTALPP